MQQTFASEFESSKNTMKRYLPDSIIKDLEDIVYKGEPFDSELWAEIVYNYASSWSKLKNDSEKFLLLDTLKTLWIGRFVRYSKIVEEMDVNGAEKIIQRQAEIFEEKFDYLRSIYEDMLFPT
jgi:hypothetical protein